MRWYQRWTGGGIGDWYELYWYFMCLPIQLQIEFEFQFEFKFSRRSFITSKSLSSSWSPNKSMLQLNFMFYSILIGDSYWYSIWIYKFAPIAICGLLEYAQFCGSLISKHSAFYPPPFFVTSPCPGSDLSSLGRSILKKYNLTVVVSRWQIFPRGCSMIFEGLPNGNAQRSWFNVKPGTSGVKPLGVVEHLL